MGKRESNAVQLSFAKDTIAGAATLLLFSAFGWPQWVFVAFHALSVPGALIQADGGTFGKFCLVATLVVSITDVVTILTLTCGISACCAPGASSPAFAPTMKVCDPASAGVQGRLVSVVAMVSIGVGVFMSSGRAVTLERSVGSSDWFALCLVYAVLRIYQIIWTVNASLIIPAVEWSLTSAAVLCVVVIQWRKIHPRKISGVVLYVVALSDAALVALPLASDSAVPKELVPAFYIMQSVTALIAVLQAHRLYSSGNGPAAATMETQTTDQGADGQQGEDKAAVEVVGTPLATVGVSIRSRHGRTLCL